MNPSEKHILEIDSVELSFGDRRILSGVYLAVETGGVTAVLGRNGCGKSCLMKILCGSLRADFRSMRIDGVWHDRFRADEVRYLAQQGFIPGCAISGCRGTTCWHGSRCSANCAVRRSAPCRAVSGVFWNPT